MQSRSILQIYYSDPIFTNSLRTICQNAISSIPNDIENDSGFHQLFIALEKYWSTDHNIEAMLTVPASIGSSKALTNISLFLNYIPFVSIEDTTCPKTSGYKESFCGSLSADWTLPSVRIIFRLAIDVILATFSMLVFKNAGSTISEEEAYQYLEQINNYLSNDPNPDTSKFRIISAKYFAHSLKLLSIAQPEFAFTSFYNSLHSILSTLKKSNQEIENKYILNINICLYSEITSKDPNIKVDFKNFEKVFTKLFNSLSKKSQYDSTLQYDACSCLLNFFGVILSLTPQLRDSSLRSNAIKFAAAQSKTFPIFYTLLTLLYCFDKSKHNSTDKKKFINKVFEMKKNQGDVLNILTYFLRGDQYVPARELKDRDIQFNSKEYHWVQDTCINDDILSKMTTFIFADPKVFESYQQELSDFLIQYASISYDKFINTMLCRILDLSFFIPNALSVLRVGKFLLVEAKQKKISEELTNKMSKQLISAILEILTQKKIFNDGGQCVALHVAPFWPIYISSDMNYDQSITHINQCSNPIPFNVSVDTFASKIITNKWIPEISKSSLKTTLLDAIDKPLKIYSNVSTTDLTIIRMMTIIPYFQQTEELISQFIGLIYSSLTDVSALAIRLIQAIFIQAKDRTKLFYLLGEQLSKLSKLTDENLYLTLYAINELLEMAVNVRMIIDEHLTRLLNATVLFGLCSQNISLHEISFLIISHLHTLSPSNSIQNLLTKYDTFISANAKKAAFYTRIDECPSDSFNISFMHIAKSKYSSLYLFYIAFLGKCFGIEHENMKTIHLIAMITEKLSLEASHPKYDSYLFTSLITFLINAFDSSYETENNELFNQYKSLLLKSINDPRIAEWKGFHLFSAVEVNAQEEYEKSIQTSTDDFGIHKNPKNEQFTWLGIEPTSITIIEAISIAIRTSTSDATNEYTALRYLKYLSFILGYFKKVKLIHSKLTFSYSGTVFPQYQEVVRIVLDSAASLFRIFYEKHKKITAGPYLRKEVISKNVSDLFNVEKWYCFILNFVGHKSRRGSSSTSKKDTSIAKQSSLNALSSLLLISQPPESLYSKFIRNLSKYDEKSLSLVLAYYPEQLLPKFLNKALFSTFHSDRYFRIIVNQFNSIPPNEFIKKLEENVADEMTPAEVRFADSFYAQTGTIIGIAFQRITTDSNQARIQAFNLLLNVAVGTLTYLTKPESVIRICDKMQSLMFTITSRLTNLYLAALHSISVLLSQELNIVSEQLISVILEIMARGGNLQLLSSLLAPWIKLPQFTDDTPIVFTSTQPQFACFTRFSFTKSFARIPLTSSLFYIIDSLLTAEGAPTFLTISILNLYLSDPVKYSNIGSTLSYIIQQRPFESVPIITALFKVSSWFFHNIQLKGDLGQIQKSPKHLKLIKTNEQKQEIVYNSNVEMRKPKIPKLKTTIIPEIEAQPTEQNPPKKLAPIPPKLPPPAIPIPPPKLQPPSQIDKSINKLTKPNLRLLKTELNLKTLHAIDTPAGVPDYDLLIKFAISVIRSTNLDIYRKFSHRLLAYSLITLQSSKRKENDNELLLSFLIPKLSSLVKSDANEIENEHGIPLKQSDTTNSVIDVSTNSSFELLLPNNSNNKINIDALIMKEIRNQGPEFAQKFGIECLTWALVCGDLHYAIQALFLYRKILVPSNSQVIEKLIDALKHASNVFNENQNDACQNLIMSYITNLLETLRAIAEKNSVRTIELFDLVISFITVNEPELQTVAFNFLSFLINDAGFVNNKIRKTKFDLKSLLKKIECEFDKESFTAFMKFILVAISMDLYELIGSPSFIGVFLLLLIPVLYYNKGPTKLSQPSLKNLKNLSLRRRNSSGIRGKVSLLGETKNDQIKNLANKVISTKDNDEDSSLQELSSTQQNSVISNYPGIRIDMTIFNKIAKKLSDFVLINKLRDIANLKLNEVKEEIVIPLALEISQSQLSESDLIELSHLYGTIITNLSKIPNAANGPNLLPKPNIQGNRMPLPAMKPMPPPVAQPFPSLAQNPAKLPPPANSRSQINAMPIYKFCIDFASLHKISPVVFDAIVNCEDTNIGNQMLKKKLKDIIEDDRNEAHKKFEDDQQKKSLEGLLSNDTSLNLDIDSLKLTKHNLKIFDKGIPMKNMASFKENIEKQFQRKESKIKLPLFPKKKYSNELIGSCDFSVVNKLPPLYILNVKNSPTNWMVLEVVRRIKAQPLNEWSDLMFKAESTANQVEVLQARMMNEKPEFHADIFCDQLAKHLSANKHKKQIMAKTIKPSTSLFDIEPDNEQFGSFEMIGAECFIISADSVDLIWKENLEETGNNSLYSVMI